MWTRADIMATYSNFVAINRQPARRFLPEKDTKKRVYPKKVVFQDEIRFSKRLRRCVLKLNRSFLVKVIHFALPSCQIAVIRKTTIKVVFCLRPVRSGRVLCPALQPYR